MKKLILISALLFSFNGWADENKSEVPPEDGSYETYWVGKRLKEQGFYKNGKLESVFQGYYDNGKLWWEGYAIDNLRHGEIKAFNESGTLKYKGHYKDNLKQGLWTYFDEKGEVNNQECYQNNEITELSDC